MSTHKVSIFVHYRAKHGENIQRRHQEIAARMSALPPPLGWSGVLVPPAPDFGEELQATFAIRYPDHHIHLYVDYVYREKSYSYKDEIIFDDKMVVNFRVPDPQINYAEVLMQQVPAMTQSFDGYMTKIYFDSYFLDYQDNYKDVVEQLDAQSEIDLDGRNNIFTLHPAQYWDAELCRRALGYGPEEVIRRLEGKVPLVRPLMDGVYTVLNDDPDLNFEDFCAFNDRFKPILGLA